MLRDIFGAKSNRTDIPAHHLAARDVLFVLGCRAAPGETESKSVADPRSGKSAQFTFKNELDGKTFELEAEIRHGDKKWTTHFVAERIAPDTYAVQSLVFDNKQESLKNPKEIFSVLNYIGNCHIRGTTFGNVPNPHDESRGAFSKTGRFMTRLMPKPRGDGFF